MTMHKITRRQAECGVPLSWDIYDEAGKLLLRRGFVLKDPKQLAALMERGLFINAADAPVSVANLLENKYDPFWLWDDIIARLGQLLRGHDKDADFPIQLDGLAQSAQILINRSRDAALAAMILLTDQRRYSIVHCLNAALLADLVASRLGWDKERRRSVVCAALTMNISTVDTQQELADQAGPLTPEQHAAIKLHPTTGAEMLRNVGVKDAIWLSAVQDHHETPLGSGYPNGHKEVSEEATLLRTTDVFSAKVSPRAHRKQMSGPQAARVLFTDPGMASENPFIAVLIKEIGIYPPGSFVKLANGETGIVYKRTDNAHTPVVLSLTNSKGTPESKPIRRDTSRAEHKILSVIPRDDIKLRLNPTTLWANWANS